MLRLLTGNSSPAAQPAAIEVRVAGETVRVAVKRAARARRFTLRVRATTGDVVLSMPPRGSIAAARTFVERHVEWIGARLQRLPGRVGFEPGTRIPLRGVDHAIEHRPGTRGTVWAEQDPARGTLLCVAGDAAHLGRRVEDFLRREAKRDLAAAVRRHADASATVPRSITLRDTTSRWGSCSSLGCLNFSWRLILAPPFVLDYLAAHEVAHLTHMNHSAEFWRLTRSLAPQTERAEAWLKAHGAALHRYGAAPAA